MGRRLLAVLVTFGALGLWVNVHSAVAQLRGPAPPQSEHVVWVAETLKRMQTITPGMTRAELLGVFTTEGGLSTGLHRMYVSRDCPYFKVDVDFEAVGRAAIDSDGRGTLIEGSEDRIVKISRPYLQFPNLD
jgi:hypothetical protein